MSYGKYNEVHTCVVCIKSFDLCIPRKEIRSDLLQIMKINVKNNFEKRVMTEYCILQQNVSELKPLACICRIELI